MAKSIAIGPSQIAPDSNDPPDVEKFLLPEQLQNAKTSRGLIIRDSSINLSRSHEQRLSSQNYFVLRRQRATLRTLWLSIFFPGGIAMFSLRFWMLLVPAIAMATRLPAAKQPEFLDQNWDDATRQFFYTTSQGSRMMPYDWFLALETADSTENFAKTVLPKLGYVPNPNLDQNPDELPVGFVADIDWRGQRHLGLTCAACHTNQIEYEEHLYQIDGAPTQADMAGLIEGLRDALNATLADLAKFDRFADRVHPPHCPTPQRIALRAEVRKFAEAWSEFVADSTPEHAWGRARLDAFGMIFNRVAAIDLDLRENSHPPNAPVSYPFLWGTSWENKVQWNGSADNTNDIERLARNVGEVLGVFAQTDLRKASVLRPYYRTSARRLNQLQLENKLKILWSPQWPAELGEIDEAKAAAGQQLFSQRCASCHQVIPHGEQDTHVTVKLIPISEVGTDATMAINAISKEVSTGSLAGSRLPGSAPLPAALPRGLLLKHVVQGSLLSPFKDVGVRLHSPLEIAASLRSTKSQVLELTDAELERFFAESDTTPENLQAVLDNYSLKVEEYRNRVEAYVERTEAASADPNGAEAVAMSAAAADPTLLAYKARPLDGIWATAPYLHNGSVPNLYELLHPASERTKKFYVGSRKFDPKHVGFVTQASAGTTELDTSLPGNSNSGHDSYGEDELTDEQRWQLVEYLKTL